MKQGQQINFFDLLMNRIKIVCDIKSRTVQDKTLFREACTNYHQRRIWVDFVILTVLKRYKYDVNALKEAFHRGRTICFRPDKFFSVNWFS